MNNTIQLTLFILALVFFALSAAGVNGPKVNFLSLGLFFLTMALGHYRLFVMNH